MGIMLGKKLYQLRPGQVAYHCPGCDGPHFLALDDSNVVNGRPHKWDFDGNLEVPTFHPSIHVAPNMPEFRCHSWIKNGMISFLTDSHHHLGGQTVPMPDWQTIKNL